MSIAQFTKLTLERRGVHYAWVIALVVSIQPARTVCVQD